jgi:Erythromycin esterase/Phosphoribosyl transferase domain
MPDRLFRDRREAGRVLAGLLDRYRGRGDVLVLGLPRGGVPVAYEVATGLGVPLDVFLVRKLGVPGHEEVAMGAIASGGVLVLNEDVVRGRSDDATAEEAVRGFQRFLTWMWRNTVVLDVVGWLRERNDRGTGDERARAGFYGLDLYSLHRSVHEVVAYLERVDPAAAARARERYACFDHFSQSDGQAYGFAAAFGAGESCEREVVEQLVDLQRQALEYARECHPAPGAAEALRPARLQRAIGVIYRPETERQSHYFRARVADQFDAVIHVDETRGVEPLERTARWEEGEVPETYPFTV